jgi:hypothetical protein
MQPVQKGLTWPALTRVNHHQAKNYIEQDLLSPHPIERVALTILQHITSVSEKERLISWRGGGGVAAFSAPRPSPQGSVLGSTDEQNQQRK